MQHELYEILLGWLEALPGRAANPEVVACTVSWAIFGVALRWSRNGAGPPADEMADQVLEVIIQGLAGSVALPARTA